MLGSLRAISTPLLPSLPAFCWLLEKRPPLTLFFIYSPHQYSPTPSLYLRSFEVISQCIETREKEDDGGKEERKQEVRWNHMRGNVDKTGQEWVMKEKCHQLYSHRLPDTPDNRSIPRCYHHTHPLTSNAQSTYMPYCSRRMRVWVEGEWGIRLTEPSWTNSFWIKPTTPLWHNMLKVTCRQGRVLNHGLRLHHGCTFWMSCLLPHLMYIIRVVEKY